LFKVVKIKVRLSRYRPGVAQRVRKGTALLLRDRGTRRGKWSAARPGHTLPPGKTRYQLYRRLYRAGLDGQKISSPPGFNPGPSSP
jgi:hypothetical protein